MIQFPYRARVRSLTVQCLRGFLAAGALGLGAALLALPSAPVEAQTTYMPGAGPPVYDHGSADSMGIAVWPLAPGVFAAKVGYVWTGWVELPEGILLIDTTPNDEAAATLADSIRARSGPKPVKWVVNTHAHEDHFGGNRYFVTHGATAMAQTVAAQRIDSVLAHPPAAESGEGPKATPKVLKGTTRIDRRKSMGPANRKVEIIWLGKRAHTAGDLIVYLPKQRVLFAGDLVLNHAVPWMLDPGMSRAGWNASLDSLISKAFAFDKLVPGHGEYGEPWKGLKFTRGYLKDSYDMAYKMASYGTSMTAVKDWGGLGPYEDAEFYTEVHYMNMRRLYLEAKGIKTPGRARPQTIKR